MRRALALILCLSAAMPICALPAQAQQADDLTPSAPAPAPAGQALPGTNCTDVQVGSARSYDCVNAQLGAVARGQQKFSSDLNAPVTASSPSNTVGTFNEAATRERLGPNFGKSVQPYRPPAQPSSGFQIQR